MQQFTYFVILHDGRTASRDLINPRILAEGTANRFIYNGPNPGYWGSAIKQRHGLTSLHEVMWEFGRQPMTPPEDAIDDSDDHPSVCISGS